MRYGYTISDAFDIKAFKDAIRYMRDNFDMKKENTILKDVDGSMRQKMSSCSMSAEIICDKQIDYVAIVSSCPLPISCLHKWMTQ